MHMLDGYGMDTITLAGSLEALRANSPAFLGRCSGQLRVTPVTQSGSRCVRHVYPLPHVLH